MAVKDKKSVLVVVRCSVCGKEIPCGDLKIPVDYVWNNGKNFCWDCIKNGGKQKQQQAEGETK